MSGFNIFSQKGNHIPILKSAAVPQGSVLGQLIFLLHINDLPKAIEHSSVHYFPDDTNFFLY